MKNIKIKSIKTRQNSVSKKAEDFFKREDKQIHQSFPQPYRPRRFYKIVRLFFIGFFVLIIGGTGGILADRFLFPYLSHHPSLNKYQFLKKTSNGTTIINQIKEIKMSEEEILPQAIKKVLPAKVLVISETAKAPGFILSGDGIILTENKIFPSVNAETKPSGDKTPVHQTDGKKKEISLMIKTQNGEFFQGKLIKEEPLLGLSLIKIEASNLPIIALGDSDNLEIGQKLALLGQEATSVMVSQVNQIAEDHNGKEKIKTLIKIDRKLDKEFNGSVLINLKGEVVGIILVNQVNQEETSSTEISAGAEKLINFIIPVNEIKEFLKGEIFDF